MPQTFRVVERHQKKSLALSVDECSKAILAQDNSGESFRDRQESFAAASVSLVSK